MSSWTESGNVRSARTVPPETQEERAQREAAAAEARRKWEAEIAEANRLREEAEIRAEKLLLENLTLRQKEDYVKTKSFVVDGSRYRYRIRHGRSGNVDVIDRKGMIVNRLCAHPVDLVPNPDTMLAQKLMLETDEAAFERIANSHGVPHNNLHPVLPAMH